MNFRIEELICLANPLQLERRRIVREIYSGIPKSLGFKTKFYRDGCGEFRSPKCVIRIAFERYESVLSTTVFLDPFHPAREMAFWILVQVLELDLKADGEWRPNLDFGKALANCVNEIIRDDRNVWQEYATKERRIIDGMQEIFRLPKDHPVRVRFDHCDLQWLTELENLNS